MIWIIVSILVTLKSEHRFKPVLDGAYTPANILYKSTAGHYRPVSYPDGPITVC